MQLFVLHSPTQSVTQLSVIFFNQCSFVQKIRFKCKMYFLVFDKSLTFTVFTLKVVFLYQRIILICAILQIFLDSCIFQAFFPSDSLFCVSLFVLCFAPFNKIAVKQHFFYTSRVNKITGLKIYILLQILEILTIYCMSKKQ